jgi:hypothetical protein
MCQRLQTAACMKTLVAHDIQNCSMAVYCLERSGAAAVAIYRIMFQQFSGAMIAE